MIPMTLRSKLRMPSVKVSPPNHTSREVLESLATHKNPAQASVKMLASNCLSWRIASGASVSRCTSTRARVELTRSELARGTAGRGATYAFNLGPLSGASLSFVAPLDRRVSARSTHSSEPQQTVARGGERT